MADGSLIFDTKIDVSGFEKGVAKLRGTAGKVGAGIAKSIGLASVATSALGGFALKAGANFDAGMSQVSAISLASGKDLDMLRQKAKDMGASTKFSATESAEALKYMAMAGWKPQQMMEGLDGVINLAAASGEDLAMVSDIVTDSLTAFGMSAEQSGKFADVLAATATNANTNVGMLGESFKYVAPLCGALGYTAEDTSLALGLMANAGVKSSQAGTSLKNSLARLAKPTKEVANGLNLVGLSAEELQGIPLNEVLKKFRTQFKNLSADEKTAAASAIFGKEAMSGMLAIINASDDDFNKLSNAINNSSGSAKKMAKIMNDNLKGDITILKSALEGFGISLYENVDNPLRNVAQRATKHIDKLNETVKKDINKLPAVIGEIMADIVTNIANSLPKFINIGVDIITNLIEGINKNSTQIADSAVKIGESLLTGIMTIAEKLLICGAEMVLKIGEGIAKSLPSLIDNASNMLNNLLNYFIQNVDRFFTVGLNILNALADGLGKNLPNIIPKIVEAIVKLVEAFSNNIERFIEVGLKIVQAIGQGLINSIPVITANADKLLKAFVKIFTLFKAVAIGKRIVTELAFGITGNKDILANAGITCVSNFSKSIISKMESVKKAGKEIIGMLQRSIMTGKRDLKVVGANLLNSFSSGIGSKIGFLSSVGSKIGGIFAKGLAGCSSMLVGVGAKLIAVLMVTLSNPIGLATVGITLLAAFLGSFDLSKIASKAGEMIGSLIRGLGQMLPKLWEFVKNIGKGIIKMLNPLNLLKAGANLIGGIIKGIRGKKDDVEQATKETVENGANKGAESADVSNAPKKTVAEIVKGIKGGKIDISEGFKELVQSGLSNSQINQIARDAGKSTNDSYLQGLIDNGSSGLKTAYNNLRTTTSDELEIVAKLAKLKGIDTLNGFTDGVAQDGTKFEEVIKGLREKGLHGFDLAEKVFELGQKGMLRYGEGLEAEQQYVQDKAKLIAETARNPLEFAEQAFASGLINLQKFGEGANEGMQFVEQYIQNGILQGKSYLEISEELRQMGLTDMTAFADGTNGGLIPVQDAYAKLKEMGVSETLIPEILKSNGYQNISNLSLGIADGKSLLESSLITNINDPLFNELQKAQQQAGVDGKNIADNVANGITDGNPNVKTQMGWLTENIAQELDISKNNSDEKSKEMMDNISNNVKNGTPPVTSGINSMTKSVDSDLNKLKNSSNVTMTGAMTGINSSIQKGSNDVKNNLSKMTKGIDTDITKTSDKMQKDTKNMMDKSSDNVKNGANKINNDIKNMCQSATSNINSFQSDFSHAGTNLMYGLAGGIRNGRSSVINAAINVMRSAVNAAKYEAGIHSPSRVMRDEVGIMLMKGLGIGIDKEGKNTMQKAKSFMSGIIDKMSQGVDFEMNTLFDGKGSFERSFNITENGNLAVDIGNGKIITIVELDKREVGRSVSEYSSRAISRSKKR